MPKDSLWTTTLKDTLKERDERLRGIRNDLIAKLASDKLGYGSLSYGEIAKILRTTQPSVSRLLNKGKNTSKPAPAA